ncbi:hypothetical protein EG68_07933 [Paragonimus skrjabini miyazakii]|uniref:RING-type E3 ubiquitin transferase BRCA1 n=1 Tax=Paragonimus skrjabini miyazakii TaxID=59628 RepID=A0A8S9YDG4_9TREM|nr:hypothetical protein EG68_07933 [Paragonimus skrjabini miyazakii]
MDVNTEIETCLSVIKRFLLCSICLDNFKNPLITPCAHVFCQFCIHEHIGRKRQAKCPLCNRPFTRRSLKTSEKITNITKACDDIITTYEKDSRLPIVPNNLPSEQLHLSQELSQCNVLKVSNNRLSSLGTDCEPLDDNTNQSNRLAAFLEKPLRASRSRILLGTSARTRRCNPPPVNLASPSELEDAISTQPMTSSESVTTRASGAACKLAIEDESSDLCDLFSITQQTQPMHIVVDEFSPVEGMFRRTFQRSVEFGKPSDGASNGPISRPKRLLNKGIRTVPSLPPLPPAASSRVRNSQNVRIRKRLTSVSSEIPSKQFRKQSSFTESSTTDGLLLKTHEVLCHVQPSVMDTDITYEKSIVSEVISVKGRHSSRLEKLRYQPSGSLRSWPMNSPRAPPSLQTRNRLLRKYRISNTSLISPPSSLRLQSLKSPGWSRWRAMCRDLRRRSSSFGLSFRRKSRSSVQLNPCERKCDPTGRFTLNVTTPKPLISKREFRKLSERQSESFTVFSGQKNTTATNASNSWSNDTKRPCKFILPLSRLFAHRRPSVSLSACTVPVAQCSRNVSLEPADLKTQSVTSAVYVNPKSISLQTSTTMEHSDELSAVELNPTQRLQCSACGEILVLHTDSFNALISPASRSRIGGDTLCSISSTYWQAEDPGDTIFNDLVHVNHLRSNSFKANDKQVDVACQTAFDFSSPVVTTKSLPSSSTETALPTTSSAVSSTHLSTSVVQSVESVGVLFNTSKLVEVIDNGSAELPGELITLSSSEVMPTVDRERLQSECNELEAVVAALQQQLEAQVGELSPNTTAELLRTAGTEPMDDDEIIAAASRSHPTSSVHVASDRHQSHAISISSNTEEKTYTDVQTTEGNEYTLSTSFKHIAPEVEVVLPTTTSCVIPETGYSEVLDVIPSSQVEDDIVQTTAIPSVQPVPTEPVSNTVMSDDALQSARVTRVEASQPPSSLNAIIMDDFIPASVTSQRSTFAPLETKFVIGQMTTELSQCPETNLSEPLSNQQSTESTLVNELALVGRSRVSPTVLAVTGSNLTASEMVLLRSFCRHFGVSEHARFIPRQTTHIVMRAESDRPRVVKRTLKYFMGILNRSWIVNIDWIRVCLAEHALVDETPYEIEGDTVCGDCHEGPRRGRLNVPAQLQPISQSTTDGKASNPGPFANLWLCAFGSLGLLTPSDFMSLALDGGASRVFEKPTDLAVAVEKFMKFQSIRPGAPTKPRAVILTNPCPPDFDLSQCQEVYNTYGCPIISIDWMLNCISLYRRVPISEGYRICPKSQAPSVHREVR